MGTTISISSTFTAEPIQKFLEFWFSEIGLQAQIEFAPYHQLFQSLLDPQSQFAKNRNGVNVALVRWQDLGNSTQSIEENGKALIHALATARLPVPLVIFSCPSAPTHLEQPAAALAITTLDEELSVAAEQSSHIHLVSTADLNQLYPVRDSYSGASDKLAHIPYTTEYFAALATAVARKVDCLGRIPAKVIIVDLDNTLWGGVVGEEGAEGVRIDAPRLELQAFLLQQRSQGKLLAIASKNNEQDAWEAFRRPEMLLQQEHFAAWRINWQAKSSNLAEISRELSLGLESFIFIDDDRKEIAEVENNLPQVRTLLLPEAGHEIVEVLRHFWPFDQTKITAEDRTRSESYEHEKARREVMREARNLEDFIANLDLVVDIDDFRPEMLARVSQLSLRTNQFNTTTIRRNESELKALLESNSLRCITIAVRDRFGDYGNVGAVLFSTTSEGLVVDSFLLSCRALGRGVEHQIVRHLGTIAQGANASEIRLRFQATRKNQPALLFLESLPAIREHSADGVEVFRLDAEAASQLVYRPVACGDAIREEKPVTAPAQESAGFNQYGHIARLLRTSQQVWQRVETTSVQAASSSADLAATHAVTDAPRTDVEKTLASIWAEVLGLPAVGIYDNFFDLGGDSFMGVDMFMRVLEAFNVDDLILSDVIEGPTVVQLAVKLEAERGARKRYRVEVRAPGVRPVASIGQEGLWYLQQMAPESPVYNEPLAIHLAGDLNLKAMHHSVNAVISRHETLRMVMTSGPDGPAVTIKGPSTASIEIEDLRTHPDPHRSLEKLLAEHAAKPFRLDQEGWRVALFHTADREHTLLFNLNHVFGDGWSLGVWRRDFARYYEAFLLGKNAQFEELPVQYSDFAVWERAWLDGSVAQEQFRYWEKQLQGSQRTLALPTDRSRPLQLTYHGAIEKVRLSPELIKGLTGLANSNHGTLFMALLAGWYVLLHRYSGQEDILTGSPIFNRSKPEIQDLIGLFMNMLVLRGDLSGQPSFRELLSRVRQTTLEAYANQEYPLEKLVEHLKPERDPSRTPFYQNMLVLQTAATEPVQIPGLHVSWREVHTGTAKTDLQLLLEPAEHGLQGYLEYNTDLFDAATVHRMVEHYEVLLRSAVANPDCAITKLDLLTRSERQRVVFDWNDMAVEYPRHTCLHEFIERQVERTPDEVALIFESQQLTYRELNARANQLAHRLRKLGVGPEVLVAICAERSVEMVVGLLGIMKAGGAYVPVDPEYPRQRLAVMLEDAEPSLLLTQQHLLNLLPEQSVPTLCLDRDWHQLSAEPTSNPPVNTTGSDQAYVIYTSGSTGKPKGVANVHRGIVNRLLWMQDAYQLDSGDYVLQKTPYSFDVSVWEFFWPLMTGACLVVARPGGHRDPSYLVNLIVQHKITTLHFVPSMLSVFLESEGVERCTSLRRVICSGEALPFDLQERFFQCLGAELHNLYGPTEAAVDVSYWHCTRDSGLSMVPIGKPIWNTQLYILDKYLQPVPIGVAGELHIGGVNLARGYVKRPELTAEKFIADPFCREAGARLYKTGDLARFLPDGNIEYLGRIDHQVKVRGLRIELGEIETTLAQCPGVKECVVMAREDHPGDKRLVAYIVPKKGEDPETSELSEQLKQHLPEYMVPATFVMLPSFPVTSNGKIDRRALPAPEYDSLNMKSDYVAARDKVEEELTAIWAELLGVPRVGIHDNFFELGGHSLLAVRVLARILEGWPYLQLTIASFLQAPTIAGFAALLRSDKQVPTDCVVPFRKSGTRSPFFCVPGGGGNVVSLRLLAAGMSKEQPFYCLQAKGLDGSDPLRTVEEAADFYIKKIRTIQPKGPYYVGGACFGGLVAFELARKLREHGEEIGLLTLIDTYNFAYGRTLSKPRLLYENLRFYARRTGYHFRNIRSVAWKDRVSYVLARMQAVRLYLRDLSAVAKNSRNQFPVRGLPMQVGEEAGAMRETLNRVMKASVDAARTYMPQYYPGEIFLFKASERLAEPYEDSALGWAPFASQVKINEIEANHENILDRVSTCIEAAIMRNEQLRAQGFTALEQNEQLVNS